MTTEEQEIVLRLKRIEGQVRGIMQMIERGRPCGEIVAQLIAVRAALDQAAIRVVTAHIDECLATLPPEETRATIGRMVKLLSKVS